MNKPNHLNLCAPAEWIGMRLDKALGLLPEVSSRSRAETLISEARVSVNGKPAKASHKINVGDLIDIKLPEPTPTDLIPLPKPLNILFEDEDLIVLNKPAQVVVHPSVGHEQDTLVNMLIAHTDTLSMGFQENRPGIVHRLDRDTSGVLVVAKNDFTHHALANLFQTRDIHRIYHAVCLGTLRPKDGRIESHLARHPTDRKRYASISGAKAQPSIGKRAVTHYRSLATLSSGLSYVELKLETGRTHQIRVHLSEAGAPIVADELYGGTKKIAKIANRDIQKTLREFPRFALHAKELGFKHPRTCKELFFQTPWPLDLAVLIGQLGFSFSNSDGYFS